MIKVEAVVVREQVEEVMDAVTDRTRHVGVTVIGGYGSELHTAALSPGMRHHTTTPAAEPAGQPA